MKKLKYIFANPVLGLLMGIAMGVPMSLGDGPQEILETFTQTAAACDESAWHQHGYTNTAGPTDQIEYSARIYTFRIYLHDNFVANVDLDSLECSTPAGGYLPCDGSAAARDNEDGGTIRTLHLDSTDPTAIKPNFVEWTYGLDTLADSPVIPGLNDYDGDGTIDTNRVSQRNMHETLVFNFNEPQESARATTTSAVDIKFFAFNQVTREWTTPETVDGETDRHWNNHTDRVVTNYACEAPPEEPVCEVLELTPDALGVADIGTDIDLRVRTTASDGSNWTNIVDYTWTAENFNGGPANGLFDDATQSPANPLTSGDRALTYGLTRPGDEIHVEVLGSENVCFDNIALPMCEDMTLIRPRRSVIIASDEDFERTIEVAVEATNGEEWPFDILYESTNLTGVFEDSTGQTGNPLKTPDKEVTYRSTASDTPTTVTASARKDPANSCIESFTYVKDTVNACEELIINPPASPISYLEMVEGDVEITWTSVYDDGRDSPGPYRVTAIDGLTAVTTTTGEFFDAPGGTSLGTGEIITDLTTVYYNNGGILDSITVVDQSDIICRDEITSLPPQGTDEYFCEDLFWTKTPAIGDVKTFFDQSQICFEYKVEVEDSSYANTLFVQGWDSPSKNNFAGTLTLDVNETSVGSSSGNPTGQPLNSGETEYTGTVCWDNFDELNYIYIYVLGETNACDDEFALPNIPTTPPGGGGGSPYCVDLGMTPDSVEIEHGKSASGKVQIDIDVNSTHRTWRGNLIVESEGECELTYFDGSEAEEDRSLKIPVRGDDSFTVFCEGGESGDEVKAYISSDRSRCSDDFKFDQNECTDLSFEEEEIDTTEGEDVCLDLELDSGLTDQDVIVEYNECRGTIEYDNSSHDKELIIEGVDGSETFNVCFTNICDDAEIKAYLDGEENSCSDELTPVVQELGEFEKYIFTFNFASEKNSYSDDGIFFSHDEDRAFYTLEYNPSGSENEITFSDDIWEGDLSGKFGSGGSSGGRIKLAKTYSDLTSGEAAGQKYNFSTIVNFGFGDHYELKSTAIAERIEEEYSSDDFPVFIPYVKFPDDRESLLIKPCESGTKQVCFEPDRSPDSTQDVVIRNSGLVERMSDDAVIRIRYVAVVDSQLDCGNAEDECLTEEFQNNAQVEVYDGIAALEADAKLVSLCHYLVTRNAGDVYLELELKGGSDVSCIFVDESGDRSSDYRNVDALVILDEGEEETSDLTVSICENDEYEENLVGNLSSYVCEIVAAVSDLWKPATVEETTESRISQGTRNALTNQDPDVNRFNDWNDLKNSLSNFNNPDSGILYFDGSLSSTGTLTLGAMTIPSGGWTLIVENADLVIAGNLSYASTISFSSIPSAAFVVQGGDIYIRNSALTLVGVYYTDQSFDGDERSPVNEPLKINGSIYGNVQPLLDAARYVGPPTLDGGGVAVYYDTRIILNTPPGLSEYIDVSTEKAVN